MLTSSLVGSMHPYLEAARERVVVYDGATGTNLQARDLSADDFGGPALEGCNEVLVDTRPDVVADLHRSFFEVGSDVVETDTFGAFSVVLAEYDIADRAHELNVKAAQIAKEVASGYGGWLAGSVGAGSKVPARGQNRLGDRRRGLQGAGEHLRHLSQYCGVPISCLPNAGLPSVVEGKTHYDLTPEQLADHHARFIGEFGVSVVGGCCGTTPEHLRQVVERVRSLTPATRSIVDEPGAASIYTAVPFHQDTSFLVIGERTNANGSKKFRDAMLESDWDTCLAMAREQVKEGAHVLDVCVDYVGRDGTVDMDEIASRFATQASLPLVFDSTEPQVVEAGLEHHGGKAILNSANLQEGEEPGKRMDRVFRLAREYGAAVICLTIDEEGQARTADWKLRVAKRIYDLAVDKYGI